MAKNKTRAIDGPDDWRIESDLRTLCDAKEIMRDPKRYAQRRR